MSAATTGTITESAFQRAVCELAEYHHWSWWHFADSRRQIRPGVHVGDAGAAGYPDLTLAHSRHGLVFVELKGPKGKLRPAQKRSLDALAAATVTAAPRGVLVHVWRPADWDGVVAPVLNGTWTGPRYLGW